MQGRHSISYHHQWHSADYSALATPHKTNPFAIIYRGQHMAPCLAQCHKLLCSCHSRVSIERERRTRRFNDTCQDLQALPAPVSDPPCRYSSPLLSYNRTSVIVVPAVLSECHHHHHHHHDHHHHHHECQHHHRHHHDHHDHHHHHHHHHHQWHHHQ